MELKDTVDMMQSAHYEDRFIAEYYQLKIRIEKLQKMVSRYNNGTLDFTPVCPPELLEKQLAAMEQYLQILEERAQIEGIEL